MHSTDAADPFRRPRGGPRARLHTGPAAASEQVVPAVLADARPVVLAADEKADYDAEPVVPPPRGPDPEPAGDLRAAVADARAAIERAHRIAATRGVSAGGELGGLVELLDVLDRGHATVLELVDRIETDGLAERRMGLPLESVLALETRTTHGERRFLHTARETLRHLPHVKTAFDDGVLGWGQVRAIVSEARDLTVPLREQLDAGFADRDELVRLGPDEVLDRVRVSAAGLREDLERRRSLRRQERRYFHLQPSFEGGVRGNFDLPAEEGALLVEALETLAAAPTGDRDHTTDAPDPTRPVPTTRSGPADGEPVDPGGDPADPDGESADGEVGFDRPRARQLADALVRMAEAVLAGHRADGTSVRARPTMLVVTDIRDLIGTSDRARRARLLWRLPGAPPALTRDAVLRLSCDADLHFLLVDGHRVLGISAPTTAIPARVRRAVQARDHGCRFPGCRAPVAWTDVHHVVPRNRGGPTTVENLVGLCRRHHMAVTEGRWKLTMTPDGIVTVRRGRHTATSDPPLRRHPIDR